MTRGVPGLLAAALCVPLAGCVGGVETSSSVPTDQISPSFYVVTHEDGVSHVWGGFQTGDFSDVALQGGDRLLITAGDRSAEFHGPGAWFAFDLPTGNAAETPFSFDFERRHFASAPDSRGTLPVPMTLVLPQSGSTYRIEDGVIPVLWAPGGTVDAMAIEISGPCTDPANAGLRVDSYVGVTADPGTTAIRLSDYDYDYPRGCRRFDARLILTRSRLGTLDSHYAEGGDQCDAFESFFEVCSSFVLTQEREVAVVITR
jgi:hypothetical protein